MIKPRKQGKGRRIRIGMVVHSYLPHDRAGVPLYVDRLAKSLASSSFFDIVCITPNLSPQCSTRRFNGYTTHYLPMPSTIRGLIRWLIFFTISLLRYGPKIVRSSGIDILHGHTTYYAGFQTVLVGLLTRTPVVLTLHGVDKQGPFLRLLSKANIVVVQRRVLYERLRMKGVPSEKLRLVPNCVDVQETVNRINHSRKPVISFVGRLIEFKRPDLFLDSIAYASREIPLDAVRIFGRGPMIDNLAEYSEKLGISDIVTFAGEVRNPFDSMKPGDIFVACSDKENYSSTSILEAMGRKMAIIATNVGETRHLIRHLQNGILVGVSHRNIGDAIVQLISNDDLRLRIGNEAHRTILRSYNQSDLNDWHKRLYQFLIKSKNSSRAQFAPEFRQK